MPAPSLHRVEAGWLRRTSLLTTPLDDREDVRAGDVLVAHVDREAERLPLGVLGPGAQCPLGADVRDDARAVADQVEIVEDLHRAGADPRAIILEALLEHVQDLLRLVVMGEQRAG